MLSGKRVLYFTWAKYWDKRNMRLDRFVSFAVCECAVYIVCFFPLLSGKEVRGVRNSRDLTNIDVNCHHNSHFPYTYITTLVYDMIRISYSSWLFHLHKITSSPFTQQQFSHHTQHVVYDPRKSIVQSIHSATTVIASNDMFTNDENLVTPNSFFLFLTHLHSRTMKHKSKDINSPKKYLL